MRETTSMPLPAKRNDLSLPVGLLIAWQGLGLTLAKPGHVTLRLPLTEFELMCARPYAVPDLLALWILYSLLTFLLARLRGQWPSTGSLSSVPADDVATLVLAILLLATHVARRIWATGY
jgi:hypothetical protein